MRLFLGVALAISLAGCLDESKPAGLAKATKDVKDLQIAANSPDAAVKSWWAVKDAGIRLDREICTEYMKMIGPKDEKLGELAADSLHFRTDCSVTDSYERKIAKVDVESETRAVVSAVIRNIEPADPGAEMDESDRKAKETGERYRYTLERGKSTDNWKIASIERFPSYARDWQEAYPKPTPSNNRYVFEQFQ